MHQPETMNPTPQRNRSISWTRPLPNGMAFFFSSITPRSRDLLRLKISLHQINKRFVYAPV